MKCVILIDSETSVEAINKLEPDDFAFVCEGDSFIVRHDGLEIIPPSCSRKN